MSSIRKQAIISSLVVYIGFFIGAINTYLYIKEGHFSSEEFALTRIFFDIGQNFYVFASLGVIPVMIKFYPYYKSNLQNSKNDLLTWSLVTATIGFGILLLLGFLLEPLVIQKFSQRSKLIVDYYHFIFPFVFGMLFFAVLEGYCWAIHESVFSTFLKETVLRVCTLVFILLFYFKFINYHTFFILFTALFVIITILLVFYLIKKNKLHLSFSISHVSKKFFKKMASMQLIIFAGMLVQALAQTMDSIFIASLKGLSFAGVYTLALYAANFIQIPQRSLQSISSGVIAQAWKDKNMSEIQRIYQRSSINMLLISLFIFGNILLNVENLFQLLHVQQNYMAAVEILIVLGLVRIVDGGTGVNGTIIATSNFWKFDFFCGVLMLAIRIPLTYLLVKKFGIIGAAYSELIGYTIYNAVRFQFLKNKFNLQPFTFKTIAAIILGLSFFLITYFIFKSNQGWSILFVRSSIFSTLFLVAIFWGKLTPDFHQVLNTLKQRIFKTNSNN